MMSKRHKAGKWSVLGIPLLLTVVATTVGHSLSAMAQDVAAHRFAEFAIVPGVTPIQTIKWQDRISMDVYFLPPPAGANGASIDLDEVMEALGARKNPVDGIILVRSAQYAFKLAAAAGLKIKFASTETPTLLIRIVDQVKVVPSVTTGATGEGVGIMRQNRASDRLCSLIVAWKDKYIRYASIEIWEGISVPDAERCVDDLVWRSFGFLGPADPRVPWSDETLTPDQKLALVSELYLEQAK